MKKKLAILLCIYCATFFYAQEWAVTSQENPKRINIENTAGKKALIVSSAEISNELLHKIENVLNTTWAIPNMSGTEASVLVDEEGFFRFVLHPVSLLYRDVNLATFMPSGMNFYYTTSLFYDITLKVDGFMPKVAGAYISSADLLKNLFAATVMPDMFMYESYLLTRVARLEQALMAQSKKDLFTKAAPVNEEVILAIRGFYNENPKITKKEAAALLKQNGINAKNSDIDAVFSVLLGKFE